jgi:beta-lactamase regulating signal transducer with metallopeptidase domain
MAIEPAVVAALGWALLDFVWQGLVVGALAALGLLALRRARPQARYALACIALAACLLLPAAGTMRNLQVAYSTPAAESTALASPLAMAFAAAPEAASAPSFDWRDALQAQMPALVAAWSAGALLLALRLLLGWGWVGRLRTGARLPDSRWQGRFDELAVHVGLRMPVPLRISDALGTPVAAGWWRPVVLVPAALLARMPTELIEALLAHELAHVRRRDYLVNLLQGAVETLLFYHPVVWWLSARVRVEREQIADDLASRATGEPRRLALALQALDAFQHEHALSGPAPLPRLVLAAHGGSLMSRIQRLVRPDPQRPDWKLALPLAGLAALGLAVHAVAAPAIALPAVSARPVTATPVTAVTPVTAPTAVTALAPAVAPTSAVAATPVVAATAASVSIFGKGNKEAYAMVRAGEDGMMLSGDLSDIGEVKKLRQHLHSDFMWFRHDGTGYVVQDPATLAAARRAWAAAEEVGERMEALGQQMQPHSERMDALGKQMEALSHDGEPYARELEALAKRMEPLAERQAELGEKMQELAASRRDQADDQRIEREMAQLQQRMDPLQSQMETLSRAMEKHSAAMQRAHQPMEELSRKMQEASQPMEALGKQMDLLGKRQEPLIQQADAEVKRLIEQALREGKAVPAREVTR